MSDEAKIDAYAKVLRIVESGLFRGAVTGALKGACQDHNLLLRFLPSITKRVAGQVMATIRDGLGVEKAPTFDPYKQHCSTCSCESFAKERIRRAQAKEEALARQMRNNREYQ